MFNDRVFLINSHADLTTEYFFMKQFYLNSIIDKRTEILNNRVFFWIKEQIYLTIEYY